jgi:hypothetical protein
MPLWSVRLMMLWQVIEETNGKTFPEALCKITHQNGLRRRGRPI